MIECVQAGLFPGLTWLRSTSLTRLFRADRDLLFTTVSDSRLQLDMQFAPVPQPDEETPNRGEGGEICGTALS